MGLSKNLATKLSATVRVLNIILALLQIIAGFYLLRELINGHWRLRTVLLSIFIVFSALILVFYEFQFQKTCGCMDRGLHKYGGFLFNFIGFAFFLIFVSVIDYYLIESDFGYFASCIAVLDAVIVLILGCLSSKNDGGLPQYNRA